jgi:hypothetical protein
MVGMPGSAACPVPLFLGGMVLLVRVAS